MRDGWQPRAGMEAKRSFLEFFNHDSDELIECVLGRLKLNCSAHPQGTQG